MFFQALEITLHCVLNILKRIFPGFTLGDATWQGWTLCHVNPVLILLNKNSILHRILISYGGRKINRVFFAACIDKSRNQRQGGEACSLVQPAHQVHVLEAAPFMRLSIAAMTTTRSVRGT